MAKKPDSGVTDRRILETVLKANGLPQDQAAKYASNYVARAEQEGQEVIDYLTANAPNVAQLVRTHFDDLGRRRIAARQAAGQSVPDGMDRVLELGAEGFMPAEQPPLPDVDTSRMKFSVWKQYVGGGNDRLALEAILRVDEAMVRDALNGKKIDPTKQHVVDQSLATVAKAVQQGMPYAVALSQTPLWKGLEQPLIRRSIAENPDVTAELSQAASNVAQKRSGTSQVRLPPPVRLPTTSNFRTAPTQQIYEDGPAGTQMDMLGAELPADFEGPEGTQVEGFGNSFYDDGPGLGPGHTMVLPEPKGRFAEFGGRKLPTGDRTELEQDHTIDDAGFSAKLARYLADEQGRENVRNSIHVAAQKLTKRGTAELQERVEAAGDAKFKVEEKLAEGGMGVVYVATQPGLSRMVVCKTIKSMPKGTADMEATLTRRVTRFEKETRTQAAAANATVGVVQVYETGIADGSEGLEQGTRYALFELVEGQNLKEYLEEQTYISPREGAELIKQAAKSLARVHDARINKTGISARIVHRDIKPDNLIRQPDGRIRITDFGLAADIGALVSKKDKQEQEQEQGVVGTKRYMAPEQAPFADDGEIYIYGDTGEFVTPAPVDHRSDIYSLGATLYEILAGKSFKKIPAQDIDPANLVDARSPVSMNGNRTVYKFKHESFQWKLAHNKYKTGDPHKISGINKRLAAIINKATTDVDERYQTADELADDLEAYLASEPIRAYKENIAEKGLRTIRKHQRVAVGIGLAVTAAAIGFPTVSATIQSARAGEAEALAEARQSEVVALEASAAQQAAQLALAKEQKAREAERALAAERSLEAAREQEKLLAQRNKALEQKIAAVAASKFNDQGHDFLRRGEYNQAKTAFEEAIDQGFTEAYFGLGIAHYDSYDIKSALEAFAQAETKRAEFWIGMTHIELADDHNQGNKTFETLIEKYAKEINLRSAQDSTSFLREAQKTGDVHDLLALSYLAFNKGRTQFNKKQKQTAHALFEAAIDLAEKAHNTEPGHGLPLYFLSMYHSAGNNTAGSFQTTGLQPFRDYHKALDLIAQARATDKLNPRYVEHSAALNMELGNLEEAIKLANINIARLPQVPGVYLTKALVIGKQGDNRTAVNIANQAAEMNPEGFKSIPANLIIRGTLYASLGWDYYGNKQIPLADSSFRKARDDLEQAIRLDETLSIAHSELAVVLTYQRNFDRAIREHEKALILDSSPRAYGNRGSTLEWCAFFQGDDSKLVAALNDYKTASQGGELRGHLYGGRVAKTLHEKHYKETGRNFKQEAIENLTTYITSNEQYMRDQAQQWLDELRDIAKKNTN
ncbi:hypothetical protein COV18_02760 [Candidatus Woesearchaeota archaeon CG10_big_fil_rev_8_21_14_0_10_37_12]|nr:MAG: hypothetical protein COV18_02760 [Candidatus Woesearchaeota archaeon CG10_big_fil_rev_8_21_14_0_10_37_12]